MTDQPPSLIVLKKLLSALEDGDVRIRYQALSEIEKLQKEDIINHQDYFIDKLLEDFNRYKTDSDFFTRLGSCVVRHLIGVRDVASEEKWERFLQILVTELTEANTDVIDLFLEIAGHTVPRASDLLNKSRFLYFFLIFLRENYPSLNENLKKKSLHLLSVMATLTREQYMSMFKDSLPVALELTHMESHSLQRTVFYLLRTIYTRISASTEKPFSDCDEATLSILLSVLSDDCAQLYHLRFNKHTPIPVLTTVPASWISKSEIDLNRNSGKDQEAIIILNYLYLISQSNVQSVEWLLIQQFNLTSSLAVLLFYEIDEAVQGCVLCLLDSIISNIQKPDNIPTPDEIGLLQIKFKGLLKTIAFIEALVLKDKARVAQIVSEYSAGIWSDHRDRNPIQWADYLGGEIGEFIISNFGTSPNDSKCLQIDESDNSKRFRPGGLDVSEVQTRVIIQGTESDALQKYLHLFYFTAEILPILLLKYQDYFSQIHRYAILSLIQKVVNNIPGQMLELIMSLKVDGKSIVHTICKILKEAIVGGDNETSKAAFLLNQSLQTTLPSAFTPLARKYHLPIQKDECELSEPKRAKCEEYSSLGTHGVDSYMRNLVEITERIFRAVELSDKQAVIKELEQQFLVLKEFLRTHNLEIATYEILDNELVSALFICFAASACNHWSKSVRLDTYEDHLDYLLERRNLFTRIFHGSDELKTLFQLLVDATEEVGSFPIYLPELLSQMHLIESSSMACCPDYAEDKSLLQGRALEPWASIKPPEIMKQWFDNIDTSEVTYLKKNRAALEVEHYRTINQILLNNTPGIFDTWFSDGRSEIAGFRPFYEDRNYFITLKPDNTVRDFWENESNCLQMSVFDWLGTGCGKKEYFLNPALIKLIRICAIHAGHSKIDFECGPFIGRNEIHSSDHVKDFAGVNETDVYEGTSSSRLIIDLGLDLIPSAYCLSCLYDTERMQPITNWCLQASNDGIEWVNLSIHRNDQTIQGETSIIPLPMGNASANPRNSYRLFRILDLSPIDRQRRMRVCGLDFFGSIVGIHQELLGYNTLVGEREIREPNLSTRFLQAQMRSLKGGGKFLPVRYFSDTFTEYNLRSTHSHEIFKYSISSAIFDFSKCVNMRTKRRLPPLRFKLAARDEDNNILASVEMDNFNTSIFKYATRLAENLAQKSIDFQTHLTLEYFLSDNYETYPTTTDELNKIFHLTYLIYQMASSLSHEGNSAAMESHISEGEESESLKYYSTRLSRLINRQLVDSTALGLGLIPHWCNALDHEISLLIPRELRIKLLQFCAFGFSRSMMCLNEMKRIESDRKDDREHFRLPIKPKSIATSSNSPNILQLLRADHVFVADTRRSTSRWWGSVLHGSIVLPRDPLDSDDGRAFWKVSNIFLNQFGDSDIDFSFEFQDEEGQGEGVDRDFFSELSREFRRKSGFMWLNSSDSENSLFVNTTFGLFPTPYPRHLVPLKVLNRFHILGISIAKAVKEGYLMDLPLSKPLLKIIVSCSRAVENLRRIEDNMAHQAKTQVLESLERCRETIFFSNKFIGHWNLSGTESRHWLTGLLDAEDFLLLYPHFQCIFPGLLELYRRQRRFLESTNCCEVKILHEFLDKNSEDVFGVALDDLCLPMTVQCTSPAGSTTVKLCDVYSWESKDASASGRENVEFEYVNNDNYVDYIRRLLEFCLDKGIRAQMEAFVAGFERIFPLKWLSMFTSAEATNLISGQLAEKPWSRDELKSHIKFHGFDEDSRTIPYLFDVLVGFDVENRRKFLRFVTGCSTLPWGGWRSLSPELKVMRQLTENEQNYPSSQACLNVLHLHEYNSCQKLRDDLVIAINSTLFLDH